MKTLHIRPWSAAIAVTIGHLTAIGCGGPTDTAHGAAQTEEKASSKGSSDPSTTGPAAGAANPSVRHQDPPPMRPSTKDACDACQGLWGVHGIEDVEVCLCKTSDEGRECLDGDECQGECLLDPDAEFQVMHGSDPPRGYYKGHCASYDTTFGCFRHVPTAVKSQLPLPADEAGEFVCVD